MPWSLRRIPFDCSAALLAVASSAVTAAQSQCYGTVSNGHITGSVELPTSGSNFSAYSKVGAAMDRTHVHSKVAEVVATAYAALAASNPGVTCVYGETGWPSGGRMRPHRTHENGLSVDFFFPVRDGSGHSVPLPTGLTSGFGYAIHFNKEAKYSGYAIDFAAVAEHLYQLNVAAKSNGVGIALVIIDPTFLPRLLATPRGPYLQQNLNFMKGQAWVRHDQHYHVDFAVPCERNGG